MQDVLNDEQSASGLNRWRTPFEQINFHDWQQDRPTIYLSVCILFAMLGYFIIFGSVVLLFILPWYILKPFLFSSIALNGWVLGAQLILFVVALLNVIALMKLQFKTPDGPELKPSKYADLFNIIKEIREHYHSRFLRIDRVILCDSFDIKLVKTPRNAFSFKFTHTLQIGLPVLQSMDATGFRALLARELSRAAFRHQLIMGWLSSLVILWKQYIRPAKQLGLYALPLYWVFRKYTAYNEKILSGIIVKSTLFAEHDVLDLINDDDVLDVITSEAVIKQFINTVYWPKVRKLAMHPASPDVRPHAKMANVVRHFIASPGFHKQVEKAWKQTEENQVGDYTLNNRVANLGHHKPRIPESLEETAAEALLGKHLPLITDVMDKKWRLAFRKAVKNNSQLHCETR